MGACESYESLIYQFRVYKTTGYLKNHSEVCIVIYKVLQSICMRFPSNIGEWLDIAEKTYQRWNYPNCFGPADGKHIAIVKPKHPSSDFYKYKSFYSVVLMAMVDYHLKFLATDAGVQGRISDGGVLKNFAMYYAMENKTLKFLPPPLLS